MTVSDGNHERLTRRRRRRHRLQTTRSSGARVVRSRVCFGFCGQDDDEEAGWSGANSATTVSGERRGYRRRRLGENSTRRKRDAMPYAICVCAVRAPCLTMVAKEFTVDLNKALVFQVGHLGEAYQEWVHQPIVSKEGPRFFENNFMEFLTRNVWWAIPTIWIPVVCWSVVMSFRMGHSLPEVALLVLAGIFTWTLIEYSLHRFIFHIKTESYWANTVHYLIHGCHHKHPMDGLRLVFPPAGTAILCIPFWSLANLLATPSRAPALFGGGLLGYVMYDCTHYYLHHGQPSSDPVKYLKRYHMNHHFRIQTMGFGITSSLWDAVFGTLPPALKASGSEKSS